jgi:predicted negative regulator of RcsB-dependent stress response
MDLITQQSQVLAYINGQLPKDDQRELEHLRTQHPELSSEINAFRQLKLMHRHAPLLAAMPVLQSTMAEISITPHDLEEIPTNQPIRFWLLRPFMLLVVAICLIVGVIWGYSFRQQIMMEQLAQQTLHPLENFINFAPDDASTAARGMLAYEAGDYRKAISLLHDACAEQPTDHSLALFLAVSYQMDGQFEAAQPILKGIASVDGLVQVPANWHLAISQLKGHQVEAARTTLLQITDDSVYGTFSSQLLKDMEQFR